jgi:hypothetical protein
MGPEEDYSFTSASAFSTSYEKTLQLIENDNIKPVASMFIRHMDRVGSLGTFAIYMASHSFLLGQIYAQAHQKFHLRFEYDKFEVDKRVIGEMSRLYDNYFKIAREERSYGDRAMRTGTHIFKNTAYAARRVGVPGIEATLSAMVIEAWGAFETTAKELWITAVNLRPKSLAKNVLLARTDNKFLDGTKEKTSGADSPSIELRRLVEYGFDLRGEMADLLIKSCKVNFDTYNNLQEAFHGAFGREPIREVLASDPSLYLISLVRNLFAHRGGLVDERFMEQTES